MATGTGTQDHISVGRLALVVTVSTVAFVVGFYAGVFALLSIVGFDDFAGWQFEIATVPAGALFAGVAAAVAGPRPARRVLARVLAAAITAAVAAVALLRVIDGDFVVAIGIGGVACVGAVTAATAAAAR